MSMIGVDYGVLNQKGSPSWFSDIYANIPTAGYKGRMFISIDTYAFYRDTGTGWDLIGGPGTGTITGSGTSGQVSYFNGSSTLAGTNNLFWDNTNGRLGIGTATPGASLDIHSTGTNAQFNGTGTNNAYLVFQNAGSSKWRIGNTYNAGANSFDIYNNGLANTPLSINSATNLITLSANVTTTGIQAIQNGLNLGYASGGATASYTNMSGSTTGINFALANGTGGASFIFPTAAGYNYTFPATTGTLALTSNLSSYVPYTGATTNVDLGNNALISGAYININGAAGSGGVLNFKQYGASSINAGLGYTGIFALTTAYLGISYNQDGTNSKTFYFNGNSITNNVSRIYTMPNADGTLALTSDITGYLPLTGGTLTGQLYINPTNTAIVGLDVASNTTRFRSDNLEGFKRQLEITMGSGTLVQLVAKGYGANYGTDLAFYTATTGGTNASPGIYITGTNNRVGIKTGTPSYDLDVTGTFRATSTAIFGSTIGNGTYTYTLPGATGTFALTSDIPSLANYVTLNGTQTITGAKTFQTTTTFQSTINITAGANVNFGTTDTGALFLRSNNINNVTLFSSGNTGIFTGGSDTGERFQVNGTARFFSTASFDNNITLTGNGSQAKNTIYKLSNDYMYIDGNTNGLILENNNTSSTRIRLEAANIIQFETASTNRMHISSGGNIGMNRIGNTSSLLSLRSINQNSTTYAILVDNAVTDLFQIRNDGAFYTGSAANSPINSTTSNLSNTFLDTTDTGRMYRSTASSRRFKENITEWNVSGLDTILALKPKTFTYKPDYYKNPNLVMLGLIAEDVAEVSPYLAEYENEDRTGQVENVRYATIVVPLIKAIQELNEKLIRNNIN